MILFRPNQQKNMFSESQQLVFNIAFLNQMVQKTHGQVQFWKDLRNAHGMDEKLQDWSDPERKPSHVIIMLAWSIQLLELLDNRIQQQELKQKELTENQQLPADWAVLHFKQIEILAKMNNIQAVKTRAICHEIKDKLLGTQNFVGENDRLSQKRCKRAACQMSQTVIKINLLN